jgi:hypothetical protein
MRAALVMLLALIPLGAQTLYLLPASFTASPGERITVEFRSDGPATMLDHVRDATLLTEKAAYNITSLRTDGLSVLGNAPVKSEGTLLLYAGAAGGSHASAKALVLCGTPSATFQRPAGLPLEIVPERDPYTLKSGESLPIRVLLRGKPLGGCAIALARMESGKPEFRSIGKTDANGRVVVPLRAPGRWLIEATTAHLSTSLTFEMF